MTEQLVRLNSLSAQNATEEFLKCCGSRRWAQIMSDARPYQTAAELQQQASSAWWSLDSADWLEAFRSHPKIGERKAAEKVSHQSQTWSGEEQSGVSNAAASTLAELALRNSEYEKKFGYIFIVCASGKSSAEMLSILKARIGNDELTELRIAAAEQQKITELRLQKLLAINQSPVTRTGTEV